MVNITIRGIDDEVYSKFSAEARKEGVPIGELVTKAMSDLLENGKEIYLIENIKELEITKKDLGSIEKPVMIKNVKVLKFSNDISWNLFSNSIHEIRNVAELQAPKSISKFQVLTKCKNTGKVI